MDLTSPVSSYRILLIEDNDIDAEDVIRQLTASRIRNAVPVHFDVERALDLATGLKLLSEHHFDLVLLDLRLPDSSGLEGLTRIVSMQAVPIVILTLRDQEQLGLDALRQGAEDYLVKEQFNAPLLRRVVLYAIERFKRNRLLDRTEASLRLMTEQLPALLWATDADLCITSSLGAGLAALGLKPGELVGTHLFTYLQTDDPTNPAVKAAIDALDGKSSSYELEHDNKIYHSQVEPLLGPKGKIIGVIGVALDVTRNKQLQSNFRWARKIQEKMLPTSAPSLDGYDIAGICQQAEETGGDYFDYIDLLDGNQGIVVADVTHHGFGPALIMASTSTLVRTLAQQHEDAGRILTLANRGIWQSTDMRISVSFFFGVLNPADRIFHYAAAGQYACFLRGDGSWFHLKATSQMLGIDSEVEIPCTEPLALSRGDCLVLLTDGFREAENPQGEQFRDQRIMDLVHRNRHLSSAELLKLLLERVKEHTQSDEQDDDRTGVIIKVLE